MPEFNPVQIEDAIRTCANRIAGGVQVCADRYREFLEADDSSVGGGGPAVIRCNWLQHYENLMDTLHRGSITVTFTLDKSGGNE